MLFLVKSIVLTIVVKTIGVACRLSSVVEQLFCKQQVVGPNPTDGSNVILRESKDIDSSLRSE